MARGDRDEAKARTHRAGKRSAQRKKAKARDAKRRNRHGNGARAPRIVQLTIHRRGGRRPGAGRKPKGPRALVSRGRRERFHAREPVLATLRMLPGLPSLRGAFEYACLCERLRAAGEKKDGARVIHYSIQSEHIHLICEAESAEKLARWMQGLCVRIARGLNKLWDRKGSVHADRYHARALRTPREVRHAIAYVLNNARKHGWKYAGVDRCSSGAAFDGWNDASALDARIAGAQVRKHDCSPPVARARTWLLTVGWRRHGLIDVAEVPGRAARTHLARAPAVGGSRGSIARAG